MGITDRISAADIVLDLEVGTKRALLQALAAEAAGRLGRPEEEILGALQAIAEGRTVGRPSGDGASAELESALWIELAELSLRDGRTDAARQQVAQALARAEDRFHVNALVRRRAQLAAWADPEPR